MNFSDIREPFDFQKGWLLWAGIGFVGALIAIALTGATISFFSGDNPEREVRLFNNYFDIHGMSLFSKDDQTWILNSIQELYFIELWSEWFLKKHSLKDVWKWDWQIFVTEFCFPCFCNRLTLLFACFHWLGPQVSGTYSTGKEVLYVSFLQKFHKILLCDLLH